MTLRSLKLLFLMQNLTKSGPKLMLMKLRLLSRLKRISPIIQKRRRPQSAGGPRARKGGERSSKRPASASGRPQSRPLSATSTGRSEQQQFQQQQNNYRNECQFCSKRAGGRGFRIPHEWVGVGYGHFCSWECAKAWNQIYTPLQHRYSRDVMIDIEAGRLVANPNDLYAQEPSKPPNRTHRNGEEDWNKNKPPIPTQPRTLRGERRGGGGDSSHPQSPSATQRRRPRSAAGPGERPRSAAGSAVRFLRS